MTFDAAEKLPIRSGRSRKRLSRARRSSVSMPPSRSSPMATTSAADSRHGSSLEWCSYGPTRTTGRSRSGTGDRPGRLGSPSSRVSLSTAAVDPEPQKMTRSSSVPPTARWIPARACSRSRVVRRPVAELSV